MGQSNHHPVRIHHKLNQEILLAELVQAATRITMKQKEKLEAGLKHLKPVLESGGRSIEILDVAPPNVVIRVAGFCTGCDCSNSYKEALQEFVRNTCPELTQITFVESL